MHFRHKYLLPLVLNKTKIKSSEEGNVTTANEDGIATISFFDSLSTVLPGVFETSSP